MAQSFFYASGTWVAPTGVTSVSAEAWGGGGTGATMTVNGTGGGGGGGGYSKTNSITVTPGSSYTVTVGGAASDSWFSTTGSAPASTATGVLAKGGTSVANNTSAGGAGGASGSGIGDTKYSGGTGGTGSTGGGGGGGGGGDAAVGGNGADQTAGAGGSVWGGTGGTGVTLNQDAAGGSGRGGGGAGARRTSGTRLGGEGAGGFVIVTYTPSSTTDIYPNGFWAANNDGSSTTITVPVKAPGTNVAGTVFVQHQETRTITGVTWNGVAMTNEGTTAGGGGSKITAFSLPNPATGVVNVVATMDATGQPWRVQALSYVGVDQTDAVTEVVTGSTTGTSLTLTGMTPNRTGCWGVAGFYSAGGGATSGTNFVRRTQSGDPVCGDTDGAESADFEMTSSGNSGAYIGIGLVVSPAVAAVTTVPDLRLAFI